MTEQYIVKLINQLNSAKQILSDRALAKKYKQYKGKYCKTKQSKQFSWMHIYYYYISDVKGCWVESINFSLKERSFFMYRDRTYIRDMPEVVIISKNQFMKKYGRILSKMRIP